VRAGRGSDAVTAGWLPVVSSIVDLAGPYVLLGWAWIRWIRDPYRGSFPWWRNVLVLLSLVLGTIGAVLFAFHVTGHLHPRPYPGYFHRWPLTWANGMLYAALGGLVLSLVARGFLRFLAGVACAWLTILCLLAWRFPQEWLDHLIDTLDRAIHY
jgi:hypothetical protein